MEIAELRQADAKDRRALENTLKPIIAAPPELLTINRKGLHPYYALNRVFVVAFSNERVAISLPSEDRRWFVLWSEAPRLTEREALALWNWYKNQNGFQAVAHYLHTRDVSAWNPSAPPPVTEAKQIMIEHGMSTAEAFIVDMLRRRTGEFSRGVIGSPFHALCAARREGRSGRAIARAQGGWLDRLWPDCRAWIPEQKAHLPSA
jgi:hypothetical protein